jgi:hypothetical protein
LNLFVAMAAAPRRHWRSGVASPAIDRGGTQLTIIADSSADLDIDKIEC